MKRRDFLAAAGAAPLLLASPQSSNESGFTPLFDGKSLDGWTVKDGPETAFYVKDGDIVVHEGGGFPAWLRSAKQYENFDFRGEFFVRGWTNSGIYLHAPEHGRNIYCGMKINIFHTVDEKPAPESMGSIFPLVAPLKVNVKNRGEWNSFRIVMDWPRLRAWSNDEQIHDVNLETVPELRHRLRTGYLGLESLAYPIRFRNLRVKELPSKVAWTPLYETAADFAKWHVSEGKPDFVALGGGAGKQWRGTFRHQREVSRFRIADVHTARVASQRRDHVPHRGNRIARPSLRDPAPRRGRRALSNGVVVLAKAVDLSEDRTGPMVAAADAREGQHLHGPDQRRDRDGIRQARQSGRRSHRIAGARRGAVDGIQTHAAEKDLKRATSETPRPLARRSGAVRPLDNSSPASSRC
jgi:hypothetical protein